MSQTWADLQNDAPASSPSAALRDDIVDDYLVYRPDGSEIKVNRTVSLSDFVDGEVTDYGPAFNAAIQSNTRLLVDVAGNYNVDTVISKTGLTDFEIVFTAGVTITKSALLENKLFFFYQCERFRITSHGAMAKIDVSAAPNPGAGQDFSAIYLADCHDAEVDHLWVYSGTGYAVGGGDSHVFASGNRIRVHDNKLEASPDSSVYLSGPNSAVVYSDIWVYNNHFLRCGSACASKRRLRGVRFTDNLVETCLGGYFEGEADTANLPGQHSMVARNRFLTMEQPGYCVSLRISKHSSVCDNWFVNCTSHEIIQLMGATYAKVARNHFIMVSGEATTYASQVAVKLDPMTFNSVTYYSTDNVIEDNVCEGVYRFAWELDTNHDRNIYRNNKIIGATNNYVLRGPRSFYSDEQTRKLQGIASGFSGSEKVETQAALRTTNSSMLNVFSLAVLEGQAIIISVDGVGNQAGAAAYGARVQGTFRRAPSGLLTLVGAVAETGKATDLAGTPTITLGVDTGNNTLKARVQGVSATTIDWVLSITYHIVTSNA